MSTHDSSRCCSQELRSCRQSPSPTDKDRVTAGHDVALAPTRVHRASGIARMSQPMPVHGQTGTVVRRTPRSIRSAMRRAPSAGSIRKGRDAMSWLIGVSMKPGAMSITSMPRGSTSPRVASR